MTITLVRDTFSTICIEPKRWLVGNLRDIMAVEYTYIRGGPMTQSPSNRFDSSGI